MEKLKAEGYLTRWNSATLKSRPVAQGELKRLLKTEKNLDEVCRESKKEKNFFSKRRAERIGRPLAL
jgi:hypothetical protein